MNRKAVLVTGGARRVGAAIARAVHAAGADVVVHCHRSRADAERLVADLESRRPQSAAIVQADLLDTAALASLVEAAATRFGRLDGLVNNASSFHATPLDALGPGEWEDLVGTNLRAPLFLAQAAASHLRASRGAIVNIVDIHAERPLKGYVVYSIAKAGLAAMTRSLAVELGPEVRVNGVAPGAIAWPEDGQFPPPERERILATTPLARLGSPGEIARAVHFLATAPFVTGQIVAVDGGRSVYL
jgi:pteridine reductase